MDARSEDLSSGNVRPCVLPQSNWRYPREVTDLLAMEKYLEKSVSPFRQSEFFQVTVVGCQPHNSRNASFSAGNSIKLTTAL